MVGGKKRKRASRATGVGRGNGEGSKAGQFQQGEPSRNPHGRPPKIERAANHDLRSLFLQMLNEEVPVRQGGVARMIPQQQAMIMVMLNGFAQASHRDQLALLKFLMANVLPSSETTEMRNGDIPPQAVAEFLDDLVKAHEKLERDRNWCSDSVA